MMAEFWKTKRFLRLNQKWAQKLADSGFIDAEREINGERKLIQNSLGAFRDGGDGRRRNKVYIDSKIDFYLYS